MSVNIPRTFVFSDGTGVSASQLESEISNLVQIINNADSGLLTWNNVKAVNLTVTNAPTFSNLIDSGLTASRVVVSDTNKQLASSAVTSTTLAFLDATSSVQTQLNTKAPLASPTFTGTVTVPNGSGATDAVAFGQMKYFQTVIATDTTNKVTSSSTFQDTALTASITPSSSSHRVKISVSAFFAVDAVTLTTVRSTIKRGVTNLAGGSVGFAQSSGPASGTGGLVMMSYSYIDSPAATSSTTYTMSILSTDNTSNVEYAPGANVKNVMILEEIA